MKSSFWLKGILAPLSFSLLLGTIVPPSVAQPIAQSEPIALLPGTANLIIPEQRRIRQARQSEGKTIIGAMGRAQQAYYLENDRFANQLEELGLGINPESKNYRYQVISINPKQAVQVVALSKSSRLRSYTAIVFTYLNPQFKEPTMMQILCESLESTQTQPEKPTFNANKIAQCPVGYRLLNRN